MLYSLYCIERRTEDTCKSRLIFYLIRIEPIDNRTWNKNLKKRNSYPANELPYIKQKLGLCRFNVIMSQKNHDDLFLECMIALQR